MIRHLLMQLQILRIVPLEQLRLFPQALTEQLMTKWWRGAAGGASARGTGVPSSVRLDYTSIALRGR